MFLKRYYPKLLIKVFRYVNFKRLLEVETGYTTNEPIQMAVTEAIEKAVHLLFWNKGRYFRNRGPKGRGRCVTSCLKKENETADGSKIYNRDYQIKRPKTAVKLVVERHSWMRLFNL
jgi:curli production assembly/transport component CsgG